MRYRKAIQCCPQATPAMLVEANGEEREMNVCVKCRHHNRERDTELHELFRVTTLCGEHYCYSPGVCEEHRKPVTGILSQKLCSEANEKGECKHWQEGESVPIEEFNREKERLEQQIVSHEEVARDLREGIRRLEQRRWWRRG